MPVYFTTKNHGDAIVLKSEYSHGLTFINKMAEKGANFIREDYKSSHSYQEDEKIRAERQTTNNNTAMALGTDEEKFLIRFAQQNELHAFILQENHPWMRDLITSALDKGVLRQNQGWDLVLELLEKENIGTVVLYFDGWEYFPSRNIFARTMEKYDYDFKRVLKKFKIQGKKIEKKESKIEESTMDESSGNEVGSDEEEKVEEAYDELNKDQQWDICFAQILEDHDLMEFKPDNWSSYFFGHGKDWL